MALVAGLVLGLRDVDLWLFSASLMLMALFNLLSLIANIFYAWSRRWAVIWLYPVLLFQGVTVGASWWFLPLGAFPSEMVYMALKADSPVAIELALNACAASCAEELDGFLLEATLDGAHASIPSLLSRGASPTPSDTLDAGALASCEGVYQYHAEYQGNLNSLSVSVALGDEAAFNLLLPTSDARGRRQATWVAAKRDRLDLLRRLLAAGVPLTVHGEDMEEDDTLLNAAASGAALQVGAWLLEEKSFAADGDSGAHNTPLLSLVGFAKYTRGPLDRFKPFLDLLVAHGARLDGTSAGWVPLREAVWARSATAADALIAAGASESLLADEDRDRLAQLHANPSTGIHPPISTRVCWRTTLLIAAPR
jgi:hypothetical protein